LNSSTTHFYNVDNSITTLNSDVSLIKSDNNLEKLKVVQLLIDVPNQLNEINLLKVDNVINKDKLTLHSNNLLSVENNISINGLDINVLKTDVSNLKTYDINNTSDKVANNVKVNQLLSDVYSINNTTIPNLDNRFVYKNGDSMSGPLFVNDVDYVGILNIGKSSTNINIGAELNEDIKVINIGGNNDIVNIKGTTNFIKTNNLQIENKIITLNKGAVGNIQSGSVGFQIRDNDSDSKGYFITNAASNEFHFKTPQDETVFKLKKNPNDLYDIATKVYVDSLIEVKNNELTSIQASQLQLTNDISIVNNNVLNNIPFSKINAYPSDNTKVLFGDGVFRTLAAVSGVSQSYVDNADLLKSDKSYVDNQLVLKADKLYVDNADLLKSDKSYVDNQLVLKADKSYVDNQLLLKLTIKKWFNTGLSIAFGDNNILGISVSANQPYLTTTSTTNIAVWYNSSLNHPVMNGGYYSQAVNRNISTATNSATITNLTSAPIMNESGVQLNGNIFYDNKFYDFKVLKLASNSYYLFVEQIN
jgi:hypothetical protein